MQSYTAICFVISLWVCHSESTPEGRIYNGRPIDILQAPCMVQVTFNDKETHKDHNCGGGILREDLILTAGHCVKNSHTLEDHAASGFFVLVGATKHHDYDDPNGQTFSVRNVYPHPDFKGHQGKLHHDVGILRLEGKIVLGERAQLIKLALPSDKTPMGRDIIVSGWGRNPQNPGDKRLYQAEMAISSYKSCAKRYGEDLKEFRKHEICAKPVHGKTCPGDSGCPAIDTKTKRVIGLDSYSKGGCESDHEIVFVKIVDNLPFIDDIMNGSDGDDKSDDVCDTEHSREEH